MHQRGTETKNENSNVQKTEKKKYICKVVYCIFEYELTSSFCVLKIIFNKTMVNSYYIMCVSA